MLHGFEPKQDHQALLKAKYCPRVAAASHTQKNTTKPMWPWPTTYDLEIQQGSRHCRHKCVQNSIKLSAAVHELSTVY